MKDVPNAIEAVWKIESTAHRHCPSHLPSRHRRRDRARGVASIQKILLKNPL